MSLMVIVLVGLGFGLAYVNGANDVSKGVATLVGSGVTNYRRAMLWGAIWTAAGGLLGAVFAKAMVTTFGNGLLAPSTTPTLAAALATLFGAGAWVFIATRTGLPVSTTHAIVGSIMGVGAAAYGLAGIRLDVLGGSIFLPLLLTPLASLALASVLLRLTRPRFPAGADADCLCSEVEPTVMVHTAGGNAASALSMGTGELHFSMGNSEQCAVEKPRALRLSLDHLHWLTSGAMSFARGMNDGPKIVALIAAAGALQGSATFASPVLFALVTCGMVAGSLVAGRRVTHVLAEKVTPMDHREGFIANLVTAGLVTAGATLGLPMSTTHVSSGGIFGAGMQRSSLNTRTLRDIALAWVVTLPAAALLGVAAYAAFQLMMG
jgi:inorganic phosphate transporter, PiT family